MRRHPGERLWAFAVWAVVVFFIINLLAMIGSVVVDFVRHPLVQHLATGGLHPPMVCDGVE